MRFSIHGVPIYGQIPKDFTHSVYKIATITAKQHWKGIKHIFMSDYVYNPEPGDTPGHYCTSTANCSEITFSISFSDNTSQSITVVGSNSFPVILINGGAFKDEYWFVFNILHELGHHVNRLNEKTQTKKEREVNAHIYALSLMEKITFDKSENYDFAYLESALIEMKSIRTGSERLAI